MTFPGVLERTGHDLAAVAQQYLGLANSEGGVILADIIWLTA